MGIDKMSLENLTKKMIKEELKKDVEELSTGNLPIDENTSLIKFGLESLQVMKILAKWMKAGYKVSFSTLMAQPTIESWSNLLFQNQPETSEIIRKPDVDIKQPFHLTDVQYSYWVGRNETEILGGVGCHGYLEIDTGHLDVERLNKAWKRIFDIHPMLKARFTDDGQQQVMEEPYHKEVIVHDLRGSSDKEIKEKKLRNKLSHRLMRIDLGEVVCLQYAILDEKRARLYFDIDLLVCDVHSFKIILNDLASYYNDIQSTNVHQESWHFAEYLAYKQNTAFDKEKEAGVYWQSILKELPDPPQFPFIKTLNQVESPKFTRRSTFVTEKQLQALKQISTQFEVTLPMLLLTLYARTIAKWSESKKFLLNLPIFDRDSSLDIHNVVADFTNVLLIDVDMTESKTLVEDMQAIQSKFHQRMKYIEYSGISVIRDLQKLRGKSFLSPVVFSSNLGDDLVDESFVRTFGDISYMISQTPQAYLDFQVFNKDSGLYIVWDSIDELLPEGLLEDMFHYFKEELDLCFRHAISDSQNHATNSFLRRQQAFQTFEVKDNFSQTIVQKFMDVAEKYPQQPALINGITDEKITYQELMRLAEQIAAYLQLKGAQPGKSVAIQLPKGPDYVASMLAVMITGCSYVPIGRHQPPKRIEKILNHEDITHIILPKEQTKEYDCKKQVIINIEEALCTEAAFNQVPLVVSDLAYVIFTSGTTGDPKGVEITHQQALNTIYAVQQKCDMSNRDVVMNVSQFDFDLSVFDIFGSLISGAGMCYVDDDYWRDSQKWLEVIQKYPVTIWNSVPTLMQMLLTEMKHKGVIQENISNVLLSGDWIDVGLPEQILEFFPNSKVIAMGGATEASIWSNYIELNSPIPEHWRSIPYGKPLPNQIYRIINEQEEDTNDYEAGELWIGGAGVAEGYFNQPDLTSDKFVMKDGLKWYKTGDKGRFWRDDTIEFLGRMDDQISLRGHRIEPGEVDTALQRIRGVNKSVSLMHKLEKKDQLVSFVTCDASQLLQNHIANRAASFNPFDQRKFINDIPFDHYTHKAVANTINILTKEYLKRILPQIKLSKVLPGYKPLVEKWKKINVEIRTDDEMIVLSNSMIMEKLLNIVAPFEKYTFDIIYGLKKPGDLLIDQEFPGISELLSVVEAGRWIDHILEAVYKHIMSQEISNKSILVYGGQSLNAIEEHMINTPYRWTYADSSLYYIHKAEKHLPETVSYHVDTLNLSDIQENVRYDLIILNNELHRVEDIQETLTQLNRKLTPGGIILVAELTEPMSMQYITTALLNEVEDEKMLNPLLDHQTWISVFESSELNLRDAITDQNNLGAGHLYVLQKDETYKLDEEYIKEVLSEDLPYYMIPSQINQMEDIPITANGKVDRKKLLSNISSNITHSKEVVQQRSMTPFENKLSLIWEELLHRKPKIDDDYFRLGGDSLLATQLRNEIQGEFGVTVNLEELFKSSKLEDMAAMIEQMRQQYEIKNLPNVTDESPYEPFLLTEVQQAYILGRSGVFEFGDVSSHCYFELETEGLDVKRLESAWNKLIQKHLSLRTIIREDNLSQIALEHVDSYHIDYYDLTHSDIAKQEAIKIRKNLEHQNFNPYEWPSFDIKYLDLSPNQGRICISFDNLFFDGFSMFQLFREWKHLYDNPDISIKPNKTTFKSYVESFEQFKETDVYKGDMDYWKAKIPSIYDKPDLNINHHVQSHRFSRNNSKLSKTEWDTVKDSAKYYGVTPSGLLLTVYAEVLARWSKTQQFTINLTRFDRLPFNEFVHDIIGDFTTLTLLSVDMTTGKSFVDRAEKLQQELWECISHTSVSGITVQRLINKNNKSQMTMPIVFTSGLGVNGSSADSIGNVKYGLSQTPQVWMDLQVFEDETGLNVSLDSIKELFEPGMVDEMFHAYVDILKQLSKQHDLWESEQANIIELPSSKVISQINRTQKKDYIGHTLLEGFYQQTVQYPDRKAIIDQHQTFSYKDVNVYANGLAQQLKSSGVQKGDIVAILSEQTYEQIIAAVAILKLGAIYVPLSRNSPVSRNQKIINQAKIKCIITNTSYKEEEYAGIPAIRYSGKQLESFPHVQNQSDDLAYIIYTSGTTGMPKGVAIRHQSAMNTILDINDRLGVTADDRTIMLSQMTFDLSVYDIFGMFQAGGAVLVVDEAARINPEITTHLVKKHRITVWNTVPSLFNLFLQYMDSHPQSGIVLNKVLLSGDWIPKDLYQYAQKLINTNITFYGLGGATEASIWSNMFNLSRLKESDFSVPYGQPLTNQRMYILNTQLDSCPIGVIGDLYIAGEGLAECYWQDEERTRQSFFYHPKLKERLYRTGDLAMYRNDGQIIFIGREDGQVKLNGYRIELGEIEQNLKQISAIKDAVVLVDNQLIVIYVANEPIEYKSIESELKTVLPSYMVPKIYYQLDSIPLTANGKVDRKQLLKDVEKSEEPEVDREWNPLDRQLQELMKQILEVESVELNDDFFLLGGDSLKAIQFTQLLKEKMLIELSLKELFDCSQLDKLSQYIEKQYQADIEEGEI